MLTDENGRYAFDDLEPGRYRIMVQKAGFALLDGPGMPEVVLDGNERRNAVDVTLQKGAVIAGRVLDARGEPLVGVQVAAMRKPAVPPSGASRDDFIVPVGQGAQSNDLGEFRLFGLPPGEYYVQAMPTPDFGGHAAPRATVLLPTYFPGTSDRAAAQPISLDGGQTSSEIVIRMVDAPAFEVSGVVRDEAGRPVVNAMVRLVTEGPDGQPTFRMGLWDYQSRTDSSGTFTMHSVTNGTYTLLAIAPIVISGPAGGRGAGTATGSGGATSYAFSSSMSGGTVGGGVTTETGNGTTIQYRDDTATRVPVTINHANVSGLEVIVRPPAR
jgi:protocatechuate 3,4-dioxygenase beta subunit